MPAMTPFSSARVSEPATFTNTALALLRPHNCIRKLAFCHRIASFLYGHLFQFILISFNVPEKDIVIILGGMTKWGYFPILLAARNSVLDKLEIGFHSL